MSDGPAKLPPDVVSAAAKAPGAAGAEGAVTDVTVTWVGGGDERLDAPGGTGAIAGSWTKNDERFLDITQGVPARRSNCDRCRHCCAQWHDTGRRSTGRSSPCPATSPPR